LEKDRFNPAEFLSRPRSLSVAVAQPLTHRAPSEFNRADMSWERYFSSLPR
jgi:hypothetical protein